LALCLQVHGSSEAAAAASQPLRWRQLLALMMDALRRPLLWLLLVVGFLWGERWIGAVHGHHALAVAVADAQCLLKLRQVE
jgi:hypothetical protein